MEDKKVYPTSGIQSLNTISRILGEDLKYLQKLAGLSQKLYRPYIKNKREIDNPKDELKRIQKKINNRILKKIQLPKGMFGGVKGKSTKDNIRPHLRQPVILKIDIKNCYHSTSYKKVFSFFKSELFYSTPVASLITKLVTYKGYLPVGANTGTMLLNCLLINVYNEIQAALVKEGSYELTSCVDDFTMSGEGIEKHTTKIIQIFSRHGYSIARSKVKILRSNKPQIVTSIIVNKIPSIPKKKFSEYEKTIIQLSKNGIKALAKVPKVMGILSYVNYINKTQAKRLKKLIYKVSQDK